MFTVGNDELEKTREIGDFILCETCGKRHRIRYGEEVLKDGTKKPSKLLGFYSCQGKTYLASIVGRDIRK